MEALKGYFEIKKRNKRVLGCFKCSLGGSRDVVCIAPEPPATAGLASEECVELTKSESTQRQRGERKREREVTPEIFYSRNISEQERAKVRIAQCSQFDERKG